MIQQKAKKEPGSLLTFEEDLIGNKHIAKVLKSSNKNSK